MANKTPADRNGLPGTLQRGKACLRCRKRKMRCDGAKPSCQQCSRAKKGDFCEYDDGKGKTRTQILRENVARLEQRVRELEDPEYTSPVVTLYDPHAHQCSESSPSSLGGSPASNSFSHSPFPSEPATSPHGSWAHLPGLVGSPSPSPFGEVYQFEEPQLPFELAHMLLDIFAPHRRQCGLEIHMGRLRDSLSLPVQKQRHPVLMNAIFLWSCYISRPGPLCQHEAHYLSRALEGLNDALKHAVKVVDIVQASCLLSMYFLCNGRNLEGSYHASAAASLAIQCGLHGGITNKATTWASESINSFKLEPAKDAIEEGERILAFWQVYNLDRCWSVVLHKPVSIPDSRNAFNSINTPWPQALEEYEVGHIDHGHNFQTIRSFFKDQPPSVPVGFSMLALRVKASAIFDRANQLATSWDPRVPPSCVFRDDVQALENTIARFLPTLMPPHQLDSTTLDDRHLLIVTHTLAHAAMIHLHYRFGQDNPISYDKCRRSAKACVAILKHIAETDFNFLDPIIGPCWTCVAETLIRELNSIETSWPLINSSDIRNEIGSILYALTNLSSRFPVFGFSAAKIQKRLADL